MAKSKFINYLAHEGIEKSVKGCVITPKKGIINFDIRLIMISPCK